MLYILLPVFDEKIVPSNVTVNDLKIKIISVSEKNNLRTGSTFYFLKKKMGLGDSKWRAGEL